MAGQCLKRLLPKRPDADAGIFRSRDAWNEEFAVEGDRHRLHTNELIGLE